MHEAACLFIDSSGPQGGEQVSIGSVYRFISAVSAGWGRTSPVRS